jgi:uncharacterized protein YdeI (YjbR/CyaY-like superfamily)
MVKPVLAILPFASRSKWAVWLAGEHDKSAGVWLKLAKKETGIPSVSYEEALEVALCYGWIDGQKKGFDDQYWLQKFTPRSPKSIWSKINTEKAERLSATGQMKPAGLKVVQAAKSDGRWAQAYASQRNISIPEDFQLALNGNRKARTFFESLDGANKYAVLFRIQTAKKAETRAKWIEKLVRMLEKNEKIHP